MYSASLVVDPRMSGVFRCKDCHMNFQSKHLLDKHKLKFCVGSTTDPDDLQLRRGLRTSSPKRIISPDDRDDYRRNPNSDQQLRSLAENHGRQMEYLQLRNRDLEKQREDIRKQLENLGRRTVVPPPHDNSADLLRELREQEIRNQRALDDLKRQLNDMQHQKVNVIEVEKPVYQPPPPPPQPLPPPPPPEPPKKPMVFPIYYGKSLVAEISAIRQAYLQNGGNDPDVLSQMSQMQAEAQAIEDQMNQKPARSPREKPKDKDSTTLKFLEMENDRLNQELRLLQDQNLMAMNRNRSDKEDELERELRRLQREHLEKMNGLHKELDDMKVLIMMQRNQPPPPQPAPQTIVHQAAQPPVSLKPYVEVEPMAPYDQYTNRFDKRNVSSAARTWVASQHVKLQDRPMYPLDADQDGYSTALVPYTGGNTGNLATRSGTPALVYNPNYAENQPYGDETRSLIGQSGQTDTQQATRTEIRNRSLRSDYPQDTARKRWGEPIKFD